MAADRVTVPPVNLLRIAAYVLLEGRGRPVLRRRVGDLIWSDHDAERASADVRQSIARIRRFQSEYKFELLSANTQVVWLNTVEGVYFDLAEFVSLTANPGPASWVRMCEVYKGELLASISAAGEAYEEWLSYQRSALRNEFITNISKAVLLDSPLSASERRYCASRLLQIDPYHEGACRALMNDAAANGQTELVRELFTRCVRTLKTDLDVDPDVETIQLYQKCIS
ncbi:MAG: AfsR/SARP family transcriptional regulator [Devosia sp.]